MGDYQGHPFHGNQWTTGQSGGSVPLASRPGKSSAEYPPMNGAGRDTQARFSVQVGKDGLGPIRRYTPERRELHDAIIAKILVQSGTFPVDNPAATVLGGGPAAGKSKGFPTPENTVKVDPDMIRRELPEFQEQVGKNKEISAFTHEESSDIAKQLARTAAANSRNILLDGTGDGKFESLMDKIAYLRAHDYRVEGRYTVIDPDIAYARMKARGENPNSPDYGRFVPPDLLYGVHAGIRRVLPAAIRARAFDSIEVYENSGSAPRLIYSGGRTQEKIHDPAAWSAWQEGKK